MTIVLDTNCLLQIVPRTATHRWLFDLIKQEGIRLAYTTEILFEYQEQLSDFYSPVVADGVLRILDAVETSQYVQVYYKWNLIQADADDNKFSDCAIAAGADYLVTYDNHFKVLAGIPFPKVICLTIEGLKDILLEKGFSTG